MAYITVKSKSGKTEKIKTVSGVKIPLKARITSYFKNRTNKIVFLIKRLPDMLMWLCVYAILYFVFDFNKLIHLLLAISLYFVYKEVISDLKSIFSGDKK